MRVRKKDNCLYGIIGLGRFGLALAQSLSAAGKDILVIDENQEKINTASQLTDNAFVITNLTKENLEAVGLQNCDVVIVCIGEKIDTSILVTLTAIRMGIKRVIAKAKSEEQGMVLETLGAEVVYPEHDMAVRLAKRLTAPNILEFISLSDDIDIAEIKLTEKIKGMTVAQLDTRKKFGLNIIAINNNDETNIEIYPEMQIKDGDSLTVVGKSENIDKFEAFLN